jgi:glycosyltransferase involved in cell wall biosynthesis
VQENPRDPHGVPLYHIGNNQLHADVYRRALEHPGVVVLHDAVLHHFFLGSLDEAAYREEFVYNYGGWHSDLAAQLWRERARSAQDDRYFRYPMLRRIVERARAVIVHNPAAASVVTAHCSKARVFEIPHIAEPPPQLEGWEIERLRHRFGVPAGGFLFGVFGHLRESKRLAAVLRAFHRVRQLYPPARLLVAGDFVSRDLPGAIEPLLHSDGVLRVPYLDDREFWLHAAAVDACINLRYPAAGETSGIAIRLMSLGKAVLVSAGEESARYPEAGCLRVDTGPAEQEMLEAYMLWLCETHAAPSRIGSLAAAHIAKHHASAYVARRYVEALQGFGN